MHGIRRLSCQKSERIPLVAARCVLLESAAESASQGGIFRYSAFVFADKNSIVIIGTLIKRAVWDTLLYELIVNTTPEKILYHSVTILIFGRQEQDFRFIFLGSRGVASSPPSSVPWEFPRLLQSHIPWPWWDNRGQNSRRNLSTTNTICRWKSLSCRVLSCSRHCPPHALGCSAHTSASRKASPSAVPAQSRKDQSAHRVGYFSFK